MENNDATPTFDTAPQAPCPPPVENFISKEYWLIVYLIAAGFEIVNIECREDSKGQQYLLWTFPHEAFLVEQKYNRGEAMPMDLHKIEDAAKLFKRNLQYYRIR